ncbi:MAG TPA: hypothetical protein VLX59_05930, partial [Acidimicrobiales bacterium]|nr:hypothetical protein [Acidimicrobiales bacterium]
MRSMSGMTVRRRDGRRSERLRGLASLAAVAGLALLAPACSSGGHHNLQAGAAAKSKPAAKDSSTTTAPSQIQITPANGTSDADPSAGITVTATDGTL